MAQPVPGALAVRRRVPPVANRHLARMPEALRALHAQWERREASYDDIERGVALAQAMVQTGDDPDDLERQLLALGVPPSAATEAIAIMAGLDPLAT